VFYTCNFHETDIDNLTKSEAISQEPTLFWCKGILFCVYQFENEELTIQKTKGIWYLNSLTYCKSEKISQSKFNGFSVEVIDLTGDSIYESLIDKILEAEK